MRRSCGIPPLLIDYTTAGNWLFGIVLIGLSAWLVAQPFATAMLDFEEGSG